MVVGGVQVLAVMIDIFNAEVLSQNVSRICSFVTDIRIVVMAPMKHSVVCTANYLICYTITYIGDIGDSV